MNIVSSFRMKEIDRVSIEETGFGDLLLMENAGIRILEAAEALISFPANESIVCLAGSGNNGGDALVIARQIFTRHKNPVSVVILKETGSRAFEFHLNLCRKLGIRIINFFSAAISETAAESLENADIIFDGLAGTGISGPLREAESKLAVFINKTKAFKLAIDIPSGIGEKYKEGYPVVKADYTFSIGLPKRCLYLPAARPFCGEIRIVKIGFPPGLLSASGCEPDGRDWKLVSENDTEGLMPVLKPGDYKNSRGHLAVFAGSPGTTGAASLCAEAALRTSAGLVSLFADKDTYTVLAGRHRAVMVKDTSEYEKALPDLSKFQAAAAGPGWGLTGTRPGQLAEIIKNSRGVLDADAISILAAESVKSGERYDLCGRWILTPHPGEFRRLMHGAEDLSDPYEAAAKAAENLNCIILLKGITTFIAAPDGRSAVLDGFFPRLGTAGSGDVLCGIIGGYAASGMDLFDAAVLGAAAHLRAAKLCGKERQWFTADELIKYTGRSL